MNKVKDLVDRQFVYGAGDMMAIGKRLVTRLVNIEYEGKGSIMIHTEGNQGWR